MGAGPLPKLDLPVMWTDADLGALKELSRKLYWAVSSTLELARGEKGSTYQWADGLAKAMLLKHRGVDKPSARR